MVVTLVGETDGNTLGEPLRSSHHVDTFVFDVFLSGKTQFDFSTRSLRLFRQFQNRIRTLLEAYFQFIETEMGDRSHGFRKSANMRNFHAAFFNSGG